MTISIKEKRRWFGGDGMFELTLTVPKLALFSLACVASRLQDALDNDGRADSEDDIDSDKMIAQCARDLDVALSYANCPLGEASAAMFDALSCRLPLTDEQRDVWVKVERDFIEVMEFLWLDARMTTRNLSEEDKSVLRQLGKNLLTTAKPLSGLERRVVANIAWRWAGDDLARETLAEIEKERREGIEKMREAGSQPAD